MVAKKTSAAVGRASKPVKTSANKPVETAAKAVAKTVEQAVDTAKASAAQVAAANETVVSATAAKAEEGRKAVVKGYTDLVSLQQDNFDAVMASGSIVAKGYEAISKEVLAYTQASFQANMAAAQAIFGAKSLQEVLDKQAGFARESLDKAVAESAKLSEMTVKLTSEAAAPIQSRVNAAVESVTKQIAA